MYLHVSSVTALIIRWSNFINTSSGMIRLCKWLLGMPVRRKLQFPPDRHTKQSLTQSNHTRWCINTIRPPDDERCDARNMCRHAINKYMQKCVKLVITKKLVWQVLNALTLLLFKFRALISWNTDSLWKLNSPSERLIYFNEFWCWESKILMVILLHVGPQNFDL